MAKDGEDKNELDDLWRELTEPRSLEGSMSDMLPSKDASADAKDGRAMLGKLVLGKFRIDKFLDGGSVGRIYSGTQLGLGRPVAIKVLRRQDGPRGELAKKRFVREAEFLASMSHPNVVEMIGFGETEDGHVVMVMEKLEGHNLKEHLEQEGPMPVLRVIHIARQLAEAVCRAHELGGVHRDLKPANVFIERDDRDRDLVKVLDFGLVKPSSKRSNKNASLTLSGFVLGTPFYMSPEQAMGETLDARADIYSFGIMLYEMLTGVPPFRGNTVAEILAKHLEANPPPLAANNPRLNAPVQLETLIRGCLAKSPKDRPESMYTVVHELDAIERAQKHLDADLQATLAGWDPNRASGDFPAPPVVDAAPPGPWREPSVTSAETWTERTQPPLVQAVNEPSNSASANAPWNEASAPPPDWNERSNNPWADRSGAAGDWSEHSLTPFPQGASPQAPATRPAFGAPPQPLALPATVPTSSSDEDLWSHAPNSSNPPLEDSNSKALVPFNQGGALLPPPSISSTPAELEPAARLGFLKHKGRSLLLLLAGIIMIALALGLVRWAENSFNEQDAQSAPAQPRGEMPQGHIDRAPTASPAMPKA